ncbi:hypothetical protein PMIN01_00514 [Paraphaeosphaeria minitans]|uniref:Uncharacterized protein n=1 Tax=Paraphaeosphaeria minitans TaxID=565426 RepID=A0A9P6GUV9_9PLEO|nr:hypothetical protein PMIN01_00514 [Paraphaeosphaeria minitans]
MLYSEFEFKTKWYALSVLVPPKMNMASVGILHVYLDVYPQPEAPKRLMEGLRENRYGFWVKKMVVGVERWRC